MDASIKHGHLCGETLKEWRATKQQIGRRRKRQQKISLQFKVSDFAHSPKCFGHSPPGLCQNWSAFMSSPFRINVFQANEKIFRFSAIQFIINFSWKEAKNDCCEGETKTNNGNGTRRSKSTSRNMRKKNTFRRVFISKPMTRLSSRPDFSHCIEIEDLYKPFSSIWHIVMLLLLCTITSHNLSVCIYSMCCHRPYGHVP